MASITPSIRIYPSNCEECRRKKRKCNRISPCANCQLQGIADQCYSNGAGESSSSRSNSQGRRAQSRRTSTSPSQGRRKTNRHEPASTSSMARHEERVIRSPRSSAAFPASSASTFSSNYSKEDEALCKLSFATADTPVQWQDVSQFLPSAAHCLQLFSFYFDELLPDVSFVDKTSLLDRVETLWQSQGSIKRLEAAIVFWVLTHACLTVPSKHPLRSSSIDLEKRADQWRNVASTLQTPSLLHMSRYEMLLDAALHALEALWFGFQSNFEGNWQSTGVGIRRCAALHLFSSRHKWSLDEDRDRERGIIIHVTHLTQKLLIMDRWIAFTDLRAFGVHPSDVNDYSSSEGHVCLRAWIESIQIRLLETAQEFCLDRERGLSSKEKLYSELNHLLVTIDDQSNIVIERYTSQTSISLDPAMCIKGDSVPLAAVLVSWLAACAFIGCSAAMPFVCDQEAPLAYRLASLRCASNLMSLVPIISTIYTNGMQAMRISRLSNHLFYALRAVILTLAGLDLQPSVQEREKTEALLMGRSNWSQMIVSSNESISLENLEGLSPYLGDITVLQGQFKNSMALLQLFSESGNPTARRALKLVDDVLTFHSSLSTILAWIPDNTSRFDDLDKSRNAFAKEWTSARSGTTRDSNNSDNDAVLQSTQTAIDAMLLQAPPVSFLSPQDIEHIIATFATNSR